MKMPTDKSWYGKMAAKEGDHEISAGRRLTSTINPTPEEIAEIERLQLEALPAWARDRISQQDAELERLRREVANRRPEDAAAVLFLQKMTELVPIRDVVKATATIGTLIEYFKGCVDHRREELAEARKATFIEAAEMIEAHMGNKLGRSYAVALRAKAEETRP